MNNKYAKLSVYTLSLLVSVALVPSVAAEEIVVSDNGAQSENTVSVSNSNTTSSQSSNEMNVTNNVDTNAETGGNSTSHNTGDQQAIVTGDAKNSTVVTNSGNVSTVNAGCCESTSSSTTVTGNGAGSENTVTRSNTSSTNVSVYNNAKIVNNISIKANTGNNSANYNTGGDTIIKTGDVKAVSHVTNGPVNINKVKIVGNENAISSYLKIAGNGAFSENLVNEVNEKKIVVNTDNFADFINNIDTLLNTGYNAADYNSGGETLIVTGNIDFKAVIDNIANLNIVKVVCGCDKEKEKPNKPHEEKPGQPSAPTPPTTSVGGPGGPGGPGAPGPGAPAATTLPVTGNNSLFFLLLANVLMFFLGMYLRLRSGRSPGYSFAL